MGRKALINTTTTLIILSSLVLCSIYVLDEQRQIINYYESSSRIEILKSKVHESEVNAVTQFLYRLDANISSEKPYRYDEIKKMLEGFRLQNVYFRDQIRTHLSAECRRLKENGEEENRRLKEFPDHNGTRFLIRLTYNLSNNLGNEVHGKENILVTYTVDFDRALTTIDRTRAEFEEHIRENDFSNMTEEQARNYIIGLSSIYGKESRIYLLQVFLDEKCLTVYYRILYSTSCQGALDSSRRQFMVYDDLLLTVDL
ncbi:MAG: hypothetical protein ACUVQ8_01065 [Nitrososphaeria archaeon]